MSKALARLGLKFSKDRPETFSHRYSQLVGINCEGKLNEEQYEQLLKEIRNNRTSQKEIIEPILAKMTELAQFLKDALESATKVKSSQVKESRDFSKEIEDLLAAKSQLTFSEIQEQLNITAPTLSSHLEKLASQNKLERNVIGRNVVYKLID
ncbi:MAG: ArsR family transcriptional regulator [Candidatus Bathyarchaeia archaeon]